MPLVSDVPLSHTGAVYRPAMQPYYSEFVCSQTSIGRTEGRIALGDLNLLSGAGLLTVSHFLQSAPNGLKRRRCMVSERSQLTCDGLADSGGYQVSTGSLKLTEEVRHRMLRYAEEFEAACILDAPTSAIGQLGSEFHSLRDCLEFTIQSARYAIQNRVPGKTQLLNVSQGRSPQELVDWFEGVKGFNDRHRYGERALTGWAMAGAMRLRFTSQLPILLKLRDDGLIGAGARLHSLGVGHPEVALALTAVQDGLRETLADDVLVSFDNATPFLLAGRYNRALGGMSLTRQKLYVPVMPMPRGDRYVGSDLPWPCSSPVADRLTLGDINVKLGDPRTPWDAYSYVLLAAHNVWVMSKAIAEANRRLRLAEGDALSWLPRDLVEMTQVIREVFRSERPMDLIRRYASLLDQLGNKSRNTTMISDLDETQR